MILQDKRRQKMLIGGKKPSNKVLLMFFQDNMQQRCGYCFQRLNCKTYSTADISGGCKGVTNVFSHGVTNVFRG